MAGFLGRGIHALKWRIAFERADYRGVEVRYPPGGSPVPVHRALDRLRNIHPNGLMLLIRHLPGGIAVETTDYASAWYNRRVRACILGRRHAGTATPFEIALSIVHELGHARLEARGVTYGAGQRARVERICIGREIALARRAVAHNMCDPALVLALIRKRDEISEEDVSDARLQRYWRQEQLQRLRNLRPHLPTPLRAVLVRKMRRRLRALRRAG